VARHQEHVTDMARLRPQPSTRYRGSVKALSAISRVNLLRELQQHGPQTIADLVEATGLHHNTAREHLQLLIRAGYVRSESIHRPTKGRPQLRYRTADHVISNGAADANDNGNDRPEDAAKDTSIDFQLHARSQHSNTCGFGAAVNRGEEHMVIHECPYSELARDNPQVCEMHHRLVNDALEVVDGPLTAPQLHPFSGPNEGTVGLERDDETLD